MKKLLLILLLAPISLLSQSIVNTLGSQGGFFVRSATGDTLVEVDQTLNNPIIFGKQPSGFRVGSLSTYATFNIINETFPTALDITAAGGGSAIPAIQMLRAGGNLQSNGANLSNPPVDAEIGTVNFGAYSGTTGSGTWKVYSSISSKLQTSSVSGGNNSTRLIFQTTQDNVSATNNTMIFDNEGTLTVPGAVTSQAVQVTSSSITLTASDYIVVLNNTAAQTVTLPATPVTGQIYIIKKSNAASIAHIINGNGKNIDGSSSINLPIGGAGTTLDYVQLVYGGSAWHIIGQ